MPETIIYRGPSGTTIDAAAMEAELAKQSMCLVTRRDTDYGCIPLDAHSPPRKITPPDGDPCTAQIESTGRIKGIVVDEESFTAGERVEGLARLLRRVLPEPAKLIAYMDDEQFRCFQGSKAEIA
jgi:hypothetical protein